MSNDAACYAIDATSGELRPLARVATSAKPNWVEIIDLP
jgi:6-phosphogluconolactonase (cycloisomerase 2 family)